MIKRNCQITLSAALVVMLSVLVSCPLIERKTELTILNECPFRLAFVQFPNATYTYFGDAHWFNNGIEYYGMDVNEKDTKEVEPGSEYIYFYFDSPNIVDFIQYRTVNAVDIDKGDNIQFAFTQNTIVVSKTVNGKPQYEYVPVIPVASNYDVEMTNYLNNK